MVHNNTVYDDIRLTEIKLAEITAFGTSVLHAWPHLAGTVLRPIWAESVEIRTFSFSHGREESAVESEGFMGNDFYSFPCFSRSWDDLKEIL